MKINSLTIILKFEKNALNNTIQTPFLLFSMPPFIEV